MDKLRYFSFLLVVVLPMLPPPLYASGSWPTIVDEDSAGTGTGSNSGATGGLNWDWSISGSKGAFTGAANLTSDVLWSTHNGVDSGVRTAVGYKQKKQPTWSTTGGACGCEHPAPTDAKVTGQVDASVKGRVWGDVGNNNAIETGQVTGTADAKVVASGVDSGSIHVSLNPAWAEAASGTVTGTISSSPSLSISRNYTDDVYDTGLQTNSYSNTTQYPGNISGQLQKAYGTVTVYVWGKEGPDNVHARAWTAISTLNLAKDDGGTATCDGDEQAHGGH